jgi:bla regulator protein blaR1
MIHPATRVLVWAAALASSLAQSPVSRKQFDVAAVKPAAFADGHFELRDPVGGSFAATGVTLKMLIMRAYRVHSFQVSGDPDWAHTLRWDIRAKAEGEGGRMPSAQFEEMLRALLEERFQLKVDRKTREMPVYALLVAKNGPKLNLAAGGSPGVQMRPGSITFTKSSTASLAAQLSLLAGRVVVDKTGLTGVYDFELRWAQEPGQGSPEAFGLPPVASDAPPPVGANGPSIFTALQEQLGLRLESQKGPVEILVIDHVEKASEN